MSSYSELRKVQFSRIGTSEPWSGRFIRLGPIERKVAYRMSGSFIGLRSSWRRARKQLSEALPFLKARVAPAQANEDLKTAQAELQRRWQYLAEAQRLSHSTPLPPTGLQQFQGCAPGQSRRAPPRALGRRGAAAPPSAHAQIRSAA